MKAFEAWRWIVANWNCVAWRGIPDHVRLATGLDARLGMCHGCLVTQHAAKGMNEFVSRMNERKAH